MEVLFVIFGDFPCSKYSLFFHEEIRKVYALDHASYSQLLNEPIKKSISTLGNCISRDLQFCRVLTIIE
jgi:hypothetical protein